MNLDSISEKMRQKMTTVAIWPKTLPMWPETWVSGKKAAMVVSTPNTEGTMTLETPRTVARSRHRVVQSLLLLLGGVDAFADDDGVIDDDAEHDDEGEGGDQVDRQIDAGSGEHQDRAGDGDRDADGDPEGEPEVEEEGERDQHQAMPKRPLVMSSARRLRIGVEPSFQLTSETPSGSVGLVVVGDQFLDLPGGLDDVAVALGGDLQGDGGFAVETAEHFLIDEGIADLRHVAEAGCGCRRRWCGAGCAAKSLGDVGLGAGAQRDLAALAADHAAGEVDRVVGNRVGDLVEGQAEGAELVFGDLDGDSHNRGR